jgi:hypothetical protein
MKKITILLLLIFITATIYSQESNSAIAKRGGIFQLGLGGAIISYPKVINDSLATLKSYATVSQMPIYLNIAGGWSVSENIYLIGEISGFGDRYTITLTTNEFWMQINSYLVGCKVKCFPFITGLFIDAGGGLSYMVVDSSIGTTGRSSLGFGGSIGSGYDFASKPAEGGFTIGINETLMYVENEFVNGIGIYAMYAWK